MGAVIPDCVKTTRFQLLVSGIEGFERVHQGKVRDTYSLPDPGLLLVIATDRVSIFDFVLPALVPLKGKLLTALTVFWLDEVLGSSVPHHLVAFGRNIDQYLPPVLRGFDSIYPCALVVKKLSMLPVECIVRGFLTGSGLKSYQKTGQVCGIPLPEGLYDGSRILPHPIFTPTTKAQIGHDEHLDTNGVIERYGAWIGEQSLGIYQTLAAVCEAKGLILADTKFEFGEGQILADEVGTPDSSRFWDAHEWASAGQERKSPEPFDKELVRNWGKTVITPLSRPGLQHLEPENPEHVQFVGGLEVPLIILEQTTERYQTVLRRLTGKTLEEYQKQKLGV